MIDSGSLGDFVSSTVIDQLKIKWVNLEKALGLQLAVQGLRSKIHATVEARFNYQNIDELREFDIANLNDYDVILGTPWIYQHQVCIGLNPARIIIGSDKCTEITVGNEAKLLLNTITTIESNALEMAREELLNYAKPLC